MEPVGYASPSGAQTVYYGVPFQLHAYPYGTYVFNGWTLGAHGNGGILGLE